MTGCGCGLVQRRRRNSIASLPKGDVAARSTASSARFATGMGTPSVRASPRSHGSSRGIRCTNSCRRMASTLPVLSSAPRTPASRCWRRSFGSCTVRPRGRSLSSASRTSSRQPITWRSATRTARLPSRASTAACSRTCTTRACPPPDAQCFRMERRGSWWNLAARRRQKRTRAPNR
jgi:hypothetical protein